MLKVKGAICGGMLLLLTGCFPFLQQDTDDISIEDSSDEQDVQIVPRIVTPENYYQSVLQDGVYPHGQSRGFGNAVVYNRLDLEQLELGLTSIAQDQFDPERYVFREGQYITRNELNSWLSRYEEEENELGLNPALGEGETMKDREESQPRYLSHILEHNYLIQNENDQLELGGIVIGLSMNSVYNFRVEDDQGLYYHYEKPIEQAQMLSEGQKIAEKVVARLRSENREEGALQNVPIVVAIFKEQPRESAIPGNFIAKAVAEPEKELERFQDINEQYYLFPSKDATKDVASDAEQFQRFKEEVQSFFLIRISESSGKAITSIISFKS